MQSGVYNLCRVKKKNGLEYVRCYWTPLLCRALLVLLCNGFCFFWLLFPCCHWPAVILYQLAQGFHSTLWPHQPVRRLDDSFDVRRPHEFPKTQVRRRLHGNAVTCLQGCRKFGTQFPRMFGPKHCATVCVSRALRSE